jgi:predicted RNase H-like HicB family nuclease
MWVAVTVRWTHRPPASTVPDVSDELHLTIRYTDAGDGWLTAQVAEIPGAISEGATRKEARANVLDALETLLTPNGHLQGEGASGDSESLTLTVAS